MEKNINRPKKRTKGWPKKPYPLTPKEQRARDQFVKIWHKRIPPTRQALERFNQGYVAQLSHKAGSKTLEIGAGLGAHIAFEDLRDQQYYILEYSKEFCKELITKLPANRVIQGDIHQRQQWEDGTFDRIISIHVLEHLLDLPKALHEILRLLRSDGVFDIVIPCEGGLANSVARKLTTARLFRKHWSLDYTPVILHEHVSTCDEIMDLLSKHFNKKFSRFFPFPFIPLIFPNLCVGMRLEKKKSI